MSNGDAMLTEGDLLRQNTNTTAAAHNIRMDQLSFQEYSPPPDGGYGWVCVAACFIVNGFTWGVVSVSSCHLTAKDKFGGKHNF